MARYEKRTLNGVVSYRPETVPNSGRFDGAAVSSLPTSATVINLAGRIGNPYTPELAKRTLNLINAPATAVFKFSADFRPEGTNFAAWRNLGFNMIGNFMSNQADGTNQYSAVPDSEKFFYHTESALHGAKEGHGYYGSTLAQMEQQYWDAIPRYGAGAHWSANIETSAYWERAAYHNDDGSAGWVNWPRWIDVKNDTIVLESQTGSMTVEALFNNPTLQQAEYRVRLANRMSIMLNIAKLNGAYVAFGASAYQGAPRTNSLTNAGRYLDNSADVSHVGGSSGSITLNGRTYPGIQGSFYSHETFHLDYHYYNYITYTGTTPWNQVTSYPELWPNLYDRHPIAREIGHWMVNRKLLREVHGGNDIPVVRFTEFNYEANDRVPTAFGLAGTYAGQDPLVWVPPYLIDIEYILSDLLERETPGSGFHVFHAEIEAPLGIVKNLSTKPLYNHHLHTVSALMAARRTMNVIRPNLVGATLYTDLSIRIGGTGNYTTVNGVSAYNQDASGSVGPPKPCFILLTNSAPGGLYVLIAGGQDQDWETTRTDNIQVPGTTNEISITYKGRSLALFETFIPTNASGQIYTAQSIIRAWEKPGYGGIVLEPA